jgi:hypothetical protein
LLSHVWTDQGMVGGTSSESKVKWGWPHLGTAMNGAVGWVNTRSAIQPDIPTSIPTLTVLHRIPWNSGTGRSRLNFGQLWLLLNNARSQHLDMCDVTKKTHKKNVSYRNSNKGLRSQWRQHLWKYEKLTKRLIYSNEKLLLSCILQGDMERQGRWRVGGGGIVSTN